MDPGEAAGIAIAIALVGGIGTSLYLLWPMIKRLSALPKETVQNKSAAAVKIGILGAAKIAPMAVIYPCRKLENATIAGVAARSYQKAKDFAKKYGIEKIYGSYEEIIEDDEIDAVYIPSPNGYHAYWTIRAMKAGKHVLCEKPLASNAKEVEEMIKASKTYSFKNKGEKGLVLVEAMHYRFHPVAQEIIRLVENDSLGEITDIESSFKIPWPMPLRSDIRYNNGGRNPELAGGSLMDAGCYAVNVLRLVANGKEPTVESSSIKEAYHGVDEKAEARLVFENGMTGKIKCAFKSFWFEMNLKVHGKKRTLFVYNFLAPFVYHRLQVTDRETGKKTTTKLYGTGASTYEYQLRAFVGAIQGEEESIQLCKRCGSPEEALKTMKLIDSIYLKAGLQPREGKPYETGA